jgi:hypothetical protein
LPAPSSCGQLFEGLGAGATVLAVINMSSASKAQSLLVLILEYVARAGGLLAFVGAGDDICD